MKTELNKHQIDIKDIYDICRLFLAKHTQSNSLKGRFKMDDTITLKLKKNILGQLFVWLNLPPKDRSESAYQLSYDKGQLQVGPDGVFGIDKNATIPCIQKLVPAVLKELHNCSISVWEFVGKVGL